MGRAKRWEKEMIGGLKVASTKRKKLNVIKIVYTKLKNIGQKQKHTFTYNKYILWYR